MKKLDIDSSWTVFLDRDGVINKKIENDYIKTWDDFSFTNKALLAIAVLSKCFSKILVVTNQRGVGKELMTEERLIIIHEKMCEEIKLESGRIDKIYYCTDKLDSSEFRKPNVGMALTAKRDYPEINFSKSIIIGDSITDMLFGKRLGMTCFYIGEEIPLEESGIIDAKFDSLYDCALYSKKKINDRIFN